ncbi:MAG: sulfurtransferase [Ideonella sp.]|nr:sulfurtransferase [Ideonella sp.]MBL0151561.1 sulfurtransferase [Ideonella sp.]
MKPPILNISTYRFVPLDDLSTLRERLFAAAGRRQLKGTVLLAEEGINLFLAGPTRDVNDWMHELRADPRFAGLEAKESYSAEVPFKRLKVKVKREIIRMNLPAIRPVAGRAPAVTPSTLARWLAQGHDDERRPVVMLDTRNGFEVDAGAFDNAIDWRLHKFSDFPAELAAHRDALAGCTVVSYCTGGIRCEKAAIVMQQLGLPHSYQLEGGILKYFEETDGRAPGWHGRCFVFDERVALDAGLAA